MIRLATTLPQFEIAIESFNKPRKVWVHPAQTGQAKDCLIFLDAEILRRERPGSDNSREPAEICSSAAGHVGLSFVCGLRGTRP